MKHVGKDAPANLEQFSAACASATHWSRIAPLFYYERRVCYSEDAAGLFRAEEISLHLPVSRQQPYRTKGVPRTGRSCLTGLKDDHGKGKMNHLTTRRGTMELVGASDRHAQLTAAHR